MRPYPADAQSASLRGNRPSRHIRPFPRKAMRPRLAPPRRGGLCTPVTTAQRQLQRCLPLATRSSSTHVVEMKCLGASSALPCGRAERVPPRKTPLALSPGYPRKAILARIAHPSEGRAPHARNDGTTPTPTLPPLGHWLILNAWGENKNVSACARPCHADAETASLVCIILSLLGDSVLGAGRGVPDADASLGR